MIRTELLDGLRANLVERRIGCGFRCLDECHRLWDQPDPAEPGAAVLAGWLAQWVDLGYRNSGVVRQALACFPPASRSRLPLADYAHLRIADAFLALSVENWDEATRHLAFVISIEPELQDPILAAVAHYWTARTLRQKGEYGEALEHEQKGESAAEKLGYLRMTAVMQVLRSWLMFQRGRNRESWALLDQAEEVLRTTDDHGVLGNIHSAYGRMLRRQGRYESAIRCFERSIEEYRAVSPRHRNVARSLANMAYVKRVLALQWRRKIDADAAGRRKTEAADREKFAQYRGEALEHLREAGEIYTELDQHHGAGTVRVNSGLLHLDGGDLELAAEEAAGAYELGRGKDHILMARARILQCMIENARVEEELEAASAQTALDYAREAVELGKQTDNSRLLARAYLWTATTLAGDFYANGDAARESLDSAMNLVRADQNDPLWQDLQELRGRIVRDGGAVDARLRAWSEGDVGNKSLQQITEEFAEVIIPKVWEKEEKKVARVAKRLKVSPKKVRRILAALDKRGALDGHSSGA